MTVSRYTDVRHVHPRHPLPSLPVVDWGAIGNARPRPVDGPAPGPDDPLPRADVAVLTWTSAEWSALDHVFVTSDDPHVRSAWLLERAWHPYSRDVGTATTDNAGAPLWGFFQLVDVPAAGGGTVRVLLFKCDAHLAHPPWIGGLVEMVGHILDDAAPAWIYSIGTAGGSRQDLRLGDVVVTNAGHVELQKPENAGVPIGGRTVTGDRFPATDLFDGVQPALFDLRAVVTPGALRSAVERLRAEVPDAAGFGVDDLVNPAIDPAGLFPSRGVPMPGTPLLTTDYYYIASGPDAQRWAALEMDDAVIGYVAQQRGTPFAFVRNISDPVVPTETADGTPVPGTVRDGWSSLVYQGFGLFTSFNGALVTWAAVAG